MSITTLVDEQIQKDIFEEIKHSQANQGEIATYNIFLGVLQVTDIEKSNDETGQEGTRIKADISPNIDHQPRSSSRILQELTKYIPTEMIAVYIAATSIFPIIDKQAQLLIYGTMTLLTPLIVLTLYAGARRAARLPGLPKYHKWPWWRMIASMVAFFFWALAIPNHPLITSGDGSRITAFLALASSGVLNLLEGIFEPNI